MEITAAEWKVIRGIFSDGFASSFHFAMASVGADGAPFLTPIGSLALGDVGTGYWLEGYAAGLGQRVDRDPRVCAMAVPISRWAMLTALWRGRARRPIGVRLHGTAGPRREATPAEVERFRRRVRHLRFLRGHDLLWGGLRMVRDVRFHAFEPVRIASLGDPWPAAVEAARR